MRTTFHLGGQDRQVLFNMRAIKKMGDIAGKDPMEVIGNLSGGNLFDAVVMIVQAGMYAESHVETLKEVVEDWVGELSFQESQSIIKAFTDSLQIPEAVKGEPGEGA